MAAGASCLLRRPLAVSTLPPTCAATEKPTTPWRATGPGLQGPSCTPQIRTCQHLVFLVLRWACILSLLQFHARLHYGDPHERDGINVRCRFPAWLGQNSSQGKQRRLLGELHTRMSSSGHLSADRLGLRTSYLPTLRYVLTRPLATLDKEGIPEVIETMSVWCQSQRSSLHG